MTHRLVTRRSVLAAAVLACITPGIARSADDPLARLFAELGAQRERHARFSERKFSALLKAPVESSGTLIFRAPDYLEKRTVEPQRETVRIEGSVVTYEGGAGRSGGQKRTFSLSDAPLLAALIESLRATLGRRPAHIAPALRRVLECAGAAGTNGGMAAHSWCRASAHCLMQCRRWCCAAPARKSPQLRLSKPMAI